MRLLVCFSSCVDGLLLLLVVDRCVLLVGCCLLVMFVEVSCLWFVGCCVLLYVACFVVCGMLVLFLVCCLLFVVRFLFKGLMCVACWCLLSRVWYVSVVVCCLWLVGRCLLLFSVFVCYS